MRSDIAHYLFSYQCTNIERKPGVSYRSESGRMTFRAGDSAVQVDIWLLDHNGFSRSSWRRAFELPCIVTSLKHCLRLSKLEKDDIYNCIVMLSSRGSLAAYIRTKAESTELRIRHPNWVRHRHQRKLN